MSKHTVSTLHKTALRTCKLQVIKTIFLHLSRKHYSKDKMPIDHTGIRVPPAKLDEVVAFYLKALEPLGYTKQVDFPGAVGLGAPKPDFWIHPVEGVHEGNGVHYAFSADSEWCIIAFISGQIR
jgi:hypothetical protein